MGFLTRDFGKCGLTDSELAKQHIWFIKARQDQAKREYVSDKKEEATYALGNEVALASEIQLRQFNLKLDEYEVATTAALMKNQEQLEIVISKIDAMLAQAYELPDGRRVFKTENGEQVFDEHGVEVMPDELEFDLISSSRPTWEEHQNLTSQRNVLKIERTQLTEYQEKLDEAREQTSGGRISEADLLVIETDLDKSIPLAVRQELPPIENADLAPKLSDKFTAHNKLSDAGMQQMDVELEGLLP